MTANVDNSQDFIDSRDIIARLEELEFLVYDGDASDDERHEFFVLKEFADEAEGYAGDWHHGATLIRGSYFKDYAMQLAEDIGAVPSDLGWPATHIDWDAATEALQMDYSAIDYDGITYWVRS